MPKRTSQEQFDQQAQHYNAQWNAWSEASLEWLVERSRCAPSHHLLDVATGTGFTAAAFGPLVAQVTGLDVSEGMLRQARERASAAGIANLRFERGAAEMLPFAAASFDLVTCRVAPHHFLSVPDFAAESYRVLRPGGRLLVADTAVPDGEPEVDEWQNRVESLRDNSHVRNYSPSEWSAFVTGAGLVLEEIAELRESQPITLRDWMAKGGCRGEPAKQVERMFQQAPAEARRRFAITDLPDGDTSFQWMRVVLAARKAIQES